MRISTALFFDRSINEVQNKQSRLANYQLQLSSGRRILTPSDDPSNAALALVTSQSLSRNEQYKVNNQTADESIKLSETQLDAVTEAIHQVKTLAINGLNSSLRDSDRASLATEVRQRFEQVLGLANATDGDGLYLFAGYQGFTQPFAETAPGTVSYLGDDGQRQLAVSPSRNMEVSEAGSDVFMRIKNGNGTFVTGANPANTGTGVISTGAVSNSAAVTGNQYQISFSVAAGVTTYTVQNLSTATTVVPATAYTAGNSISFDGIQMEITGTPANGDSFSVNPSQNQSLFDTINNVIAALNTKAENNPAAMAQITNQINGSLLDLDNSLNNILTVQSSMGSRQREIDSLQQSGSDLNIQYQQTLSRLQDVDYAEVISAFNLTISSLEAAQKAFQRTQSLSLFNLI